jgi:hypothetical protein
MEATLNERDLPRMSRNLAHVINSSALVESGSTVMQRMRDSATGIWKGLCIYTLRGLLENYSYPAWMTQIP